MRNLTVVLFVILLSSLGCTSNISLGGPKGLHMAQSLMGAAGTNITKEGDLRQGNATWGNGSIDVTKTTVKIDRRGVSKNLRAVLGDGLGIVIADKALCAIPAVAASCVFDNGGVAKFVGDEQSRAKAETQFRALFPSTEEPEH